MHPSEYNFCGIKLVKDKNIFKYVGGTPTLEIILDIDPAYPSRSTQIDPPILYRVTVHCYNKPTLSCMKELIDSFVHFGISPEEVLNRSKANIKEVAESLSCLQLT